MILILKPLIKFRLLRFQDPLKNILKYVSFVMEKMKTIVFFFIQGAKTTTAPQKGGLPGKSDVPVARWFWAGFCPRPLQNSMKSIVFTSLSSGSGVAPWVTHARARGNAFSLLRTIRRAAEGEPHLL